MSGTPPVHQHVQMLCMCTQPCILSREKKGGGRGENPACLKIRMYSLTNGLQPFDVPRGLEKIPAQEDECKQDHCGRDKDERIAVGGSHQYSHKPQQKLGGEIGTVISCEYGCLLRYLQRDTPRMCEVRGHPKNRCPWKIYSALVLQEP